MTENSRNEDFLAATKKRNPAINRDFLTKMKQKALSGSFTDNKKSSKNSRQVVTVKRSLRINP